MNKKNSETTGPLAVATPSIPPSPPPQPIPFVALTMDSTSHLEISFMENKHYSKELIEKADMVYDFAKLQDLKKSDINKFLKEGRRQINTCCQAIESLTAHTHVFIVKNLVRVGIILNEIENSFARKSKYDEWVRKNLYSRMRHFEHAKQLARMGDFALQCASLGKNRLIDFDRVKKFTEKSYGEILTAHPFPDTTMDMEGKLASEHIDGIITYYRFKKAAVDFVEFDQAALMAAYHHGAIEVNKVEKIKERLDQEQNKKEFFEDYVMDKMRFPEERKSVKISWESLNMLLASIVDYHKKVNIEDPEWIRRQREILSESLFTDAFGFLSALKDKWGIDVTVPQKPKLEKKEVKK